MSIPFTQYLLPNGRKRAEQIDRSPEIEAIAHKFIDSGGWFECEILTTGKVSLTACYNVDGEPQDLLCTFTENVPGVLEEAVDRLVRAAGEWKP